MTAPPLSRCPSCGARGTRIVDVIDHDGYQMRFDYCGLCGRNFPKEPPKEEHKQAADR